MAQELTSVFLVFSVLILVPFIVYVEIFQHCCEESTPVDNDTMWKKAINSLAINLSFYVTKFSFLVCGYHSLLIVALTVFCANEAIEKLDIAVDLNYYTRTSVRGAEVMMRAAVP